MRVVTRTRPGAGRVFVVLLVAALALTLVMAAVAAAREEETPEPTTLTFGATPTVVAWAQPWSLTGQLTGSESEPVPDAVVDLQSSIDGGITWATLESVIPAAGTSTYAASEAAPYQKMLFRLFYWGDATHAWSASDPVTVAPRVKLGTPAAPSGVLSGAKFVAYGSLKPQQPRRSRTVRIRCYLKRGGSWVLKKAYWTANANRGSASRYSAVISLGTRGTWKLVAYAPPTAKYAATTSAGRTVKVR
jgi:hypothetical protein